MDIVKKQGRNRIKRLIRPVATLSIEAQERHERDEKIFIDD